MPKPGKSHANNLQKLHSRAENDTAYRAF